MSSSGELRDNGRLARFVSYKAEPGRSRGLRPDHPAVVEGRTLFPGNVKGVADSVRFLISGENNGKIGKVVTKGEWAGFPIFTLTLEERATCPRSCAMWPSCYGGAMQWPKRWDHTDPLFLDTLRAEIITKCRLHPAGLVIRLHVLGDFYSVAYVKMWAEMVDRFPQLHVYGYTARRAEEDDIGRALEWLADQAFDQFAIRFSRPEPGPGRAVVFDAPSDDPGVIMCPAQTSKTETCGTCTLCWAEAARGKTIGFLRHGMKPPKLGETKAGRTMKGAIAGETMEQRTERVRAFMAEHPDWSYGRVADWLSVPLYVPSRIGRAQEQKRRRGRPGRQWGSPAIAFAPSEQPTTTAEERIAAVPDEEKAAILARYGAAGFKPAGGNENGEQ